MANRLGTQDLIQSAGMQVSFDLPTEHSSDQYFYQVKEDEGRYTGQQGLFDAKLH